MKDKLLTQLRTWKVQVVENPKKRYALLAIVILVIIAGIVYAVWPKSTQAVEAKVTKVQVMTIGQDAVGDVQTYAGEVHSSYSTDIAFQVSGRVIEKRVKVGDRVSKGQVLAVLDSSDLEQSQRTAQAQVNNAESQLALQERNNSRYGQLASEGAISQVTYDTQNQQYQAAQAQYDQAQAQLEQSNLQLQHTQLVADHDGVVTALNLDAGKIVSAGQAVASIADDSALEIQFSVPEKEVKNYQVGQDVTVSFQDDNSGIMQARVREVAPMADATTRTFLIKADFINPPSWLRLGMTARVNQDQSNMTGIKVPRSAIVSQGTTGVYIVSNHQVDFTPVTVLTSQGDYAIITGNIHKGDVIVTAGVSKLQDGQSVEEISE